MGYYIRVLSPRAEPVPPSVLRDAVKKYGATLSDDNLPAAWTDVEVLRADGEALCLIERNSVDPGSLASEEIKEFQDEVSDYLPESGAEWLKTYLPAVKTIYAIQILGTVYEGNGWDVVGDVHEEIWRSAGGIIQADGEGFSNENRDHILWQFSDDVAGNWDVAVLKNSTWFKFEMDLANQAHREAFQRGEVPPGISAISDS